MNDWTIGLIAGQAAGLTIAGSAGWYFYRRMKMLGEKNRRVEQLAELGTLTGGLAHEIKNPLSTVQLNLQLLAEDLAQDPSTSQRVTSRLSTIRRETARLRDTLDDFLRYAGRVEVQAEPTDLDRLLEELVDFLFPQAQLSKVVLRHLRSKQPVVVPADPRLIRQGALNLMLNAIQAMTGGGELIVEARQSAVDGRLCFTDTGPGISAEDREKIFQAYFTRRRGGTGLGLAMTKRIAEAHGGRIEVDTEPGRGSQFTIVLPADGSGS